LIDVLTNVINFWEQHLFSLGVLSTARTFGHKNQICARSRADCEKNKLDFELVKGHRFHQTMRLQRYNYETETVEPVDLTDSKLQFNIYKPSYEIDLSLTHDASGKEFKKTITLNKEENEAVLECKTDEERQTYLNSLPSAQEAVRQLAIEAGLAKKSADTLDSSREEDT